MDVEVSNRIFEKLDSQSDVISYLKETVGIMSHQLTDMHKCIEGNGKPGLKQDIATIRETFSEHKKEDFKVRLLFGVGLVAIASGGVTSGAMFFELLKKMILGL
jgi:DNA-binding MltR family transcriptional regulator